MNDILFEVVKAVLAVILLVLARYAVPYAKMALEDTRYAWIEGWVEMSVKAAEQTITGGKTGEEKKKAVTEFVRKLLAEKNIAITYEQLDTLIESAVYIMNKEEA